MHSISRGLRLSGSTLALVAATSFVPWSAMAQNTGAADLPLEQVVVTGTSIRGVTAPVGSNLITFGVEEINQTAGADTDVFQIMKAIPALSTSQAASQLGGDVQPEIHEMGASASNSTLVLIDGHRTALTGTNHPLVDPGVIAPIVLERIEVLPDAASATYGSDAVAGVVNFITRKKFEGLEVKGSTGFGNGVSRYNFATLLGESWANGSAMISYSYEWESALYASARYWAHGDQTPNGGTNADSFAGDPATIQPNGTGPVYLSAQSTTTLPSSAAQYAPFDNTLKNLGASQGNSTVTKTNSLLPRQIRQNIYSKFTQDFGDNLTTSIDFAMLNRTDNSADQLGSLAGVTATAFQTGSQANPFYQNPPGVTATKQTIRWNAATLLDPLLGPSHTQIGSENGFLDFNATYTIPDTSWRATLLALVGKDHSYRYDTGLLCSACAYLAINGTTQSNGSLTTPSIPGTTTSITRLPLTTANALDVWDPAASNKTSQSVLQGLNDNNDSTDFFNNTNQYRLGFDGPLFDLPAGALSLAFGGEYDRYFLSEHQTQNSGSGGSSQSGNSTYFYSFNRNVKAAYAELNIPVAGGSFTAPLIQKLDIDVSARYDDYSDVGDTFNPKVGFNWTVVDGLKFRGSMAKSFVAPGMDIVGNQYGNDAGSGYTASTVAFSVPLANFPTAAGLPGCGTLGQVTCNVGSATPGIQISNGNRNIKPQRGFTWSVGTDIAPDFLPGFTTSITYWNNKFDGASTAPNLSTVVNVPNLNYLLSFYPGGATAAQIAGLTAHIPQSGAIGPVYYAYYQIQANVINIQARGVDIDAEYVYPTDEWGVFKIGDALTEFTEYTLQTGDTAPIFNVLNTNGILTPFPNVQTQMRANFGWAFENFNLAIFANFTGSYRNWSSTTVAPILYDSQGRPIGGGDVVHSNLTWDAHFAYDLTTKDFGDAELYLDGQNIFSARPPFYNGPTGYDGKEASPIGRVITIGVRSKF